MKKKILWVTISVLLVLIAWLSLRPWMTGVAEKLFADPPENGHSKYFHNEPTEISSLPSLSEPSDNLRLKGGVSGRVVRGPQCLGTGSAKDCPETPFAADLILVTGDGKRSVKTFSANRNGFFAVEAPPGQYIVRSGGAEQITIYCSNEGVVNVGEDGSFTDVPVYCNTELEGLIQTVTVAPVRTIPTPRGKRLGYQEEGSLGKVIGGPIFSDGSWWWQIDYYNDPDGWSTEESIRKFHY